MRQEWKWLKACETSMPLLTFVLNSHLRGGKLVTRNVRKFRQKKGGKKQKHALL
jgi:hypothetical protein